jgi:hypothetical protein
MLIARIVLALSALLWTPYGIQCLLDPGSLSAAGLSATDATGTAELRAMYGGLQIALGLLALAGALRPALARTALITLAVACAGLGFARLGAAIHGDAFSPYTRMALGLELVTLVATVALLVRVPFPVATAKAVAP